MVDSVVAAKTTDAPVDPNKSAQNNADLVTSGKPLKVGVVPDSQARGDQFGHVPPPKGSYPKGSGTIPAVDDTTLTQMPHPATIARGGPNLEPFGREMNHPNAMPGEHFVRDPQVFHTDPTSREDEEDGTTHASSSTQGLTKASVSSAGK